MIGLMKAPKQKAQEEALSLKDVAKQFLVGPPPGPKKGESEALQAKGDKLFSCEKEAVGIIRKRRLEIVLAETHKEVTKDNDYQLIDLSFLRRRRWQANLGIPVPMFAVFDPDVPNVTLEGIKGAKRSCVDLSPHIGETMKYYRDVLSDLNDMARANRWAMMEMEGKDEDEEVICSLSARWGGSIPDDARKSIRTANGQFSQVALIAEVKEWAYNEQSSWIDPDPLIVGFKAVEQCCYLSYFIGAFNLTPAEKYVLDEFKT